MTQKFVGKVAAGAGIGMLLGSAAPAISGVNPLVGACAIAPGAIPAAAVTGATVGGAVGGREKVMIDHEVSRVDSSYYEGRLNL